jgi:hypothetical protein
MGDLCPAHPWRQGRRAAAPFRRCVCYVIPLRSADDRPYHQAGDKLAQVGPVSELDKAAQAARPPLRADMVEKVDVNLAETRPGAQRAPAGQ